MVEAAQVTAPVAGPLAPEVTAPDAARPAWLPEKFKTAEDMASAYSELEKKQSTAPVEQTPEAPVDNPGATAADAEVTPASYGKAVDAAIETAGLTPQFVNDEWAKDGKLSDDTYTKLEAAGFDRKVIDTYVKGFADANAAPPAAVEVSEADLASIKGIAGGDKGYADMITWAKAELPQADSEAYNRVLATGDVALIALAATGLHAKFVAADGKEPTNLLLGGNRPGVDQFPSMQAMSQAMIEARKSGDPAQIRAVEQKAMRSTYQ